ncbi:MAG: imidazole glycerol phosphate synthase cyclase subunit [Candidatus Sungbacteria bacterium RIFCSPLOWO2_01_FULL_60_25]|uniref:imidazole glycerol-phosphate synthase n=1 Tax=Candidatus Sungbacteria bacterium RIFCSPLOWO2_01_FULL_60_25 TaxID=1802281 RepID=A0A1G2LAW4_9BACT|nr:MAG: imidazole glycerol phosphate synthase cyclase subunit [Candidatus Sungbacteria bacterium RIFCSPLOWO2_01_FULL_60_25]
MLKKRLIPCLLLQNGQLVKSIRFKDYQIVGNPKIAIQFFNAWAVDEIVFLDISRDRDYTSRLRTDYKFRMLATLAEIVRECSRICFVPLTVGGGIRTVEHMRELFRNGADKICINTGAVRRPELVTEAAATFGSQAVVVSIDAKRVADGGYEVYIDHGQEPTGLNPREWAREAAGRGAGEIFLNSIDRDGSLAGYDLELIRTVVAAVRIPVVACGGVGKWQDLVEGIRAGASAVAAANIFHFTEQSTRNAKKHLASAGIDVRL